MTEATHAHPTPRDYWMIAAVLFAITAVEVAVVYMDAVDRFIVPILLTLSVAKFALVVGWFMHLKYDLKRYRRFFYLGLAGAVILLGGMLLTFGVLVGH